VLGREPAEPPPPVEGLLGWVDGRLKLDEPRL
jgi:hypothetical protein